MALQNEKFVCESDEWLRSSCKDERFFKQHSDKNYCVLHYPDFDKLDAFAEAVQRKIDSRNYDFKGAWFPIEFKFQYFDAQIEMDFSYAHFTKETKFTSTKFKNRIDFSYACFAEIVYFNWAEFHLETNFFHAHFLKNAWFYKTEFQKRVDFGQATFESKTFFHETNFVGEANFSSAKIFDNISFKSATFQDYASFDGHSSHEQFTEKTIFEFQYTRFRKPELISFHSMNLSPNWFVDVDSRKLIFINSIWNLDIKREIKTLESRGIYYPEKLLRIACQQLSTNMEENNLYDEASKFRQIALEMEKAEKSESLRQSFKAFSKRESYKVESKGYLGIFLRLTKNFFVRIFNLLLHYFYKITSFYGESWILATFMLLSIFVISSMLYSLPISSFNISQSETDYFDKLVTTKSPSPSPSDDGIEKKIFEVADTAEKYRSLKLNEAVIYSFQVGTFQSPDTKPSNIFAKVFVAIESILVPLQFALLALAIRRKFMR